MSQENTPMEAKSLENANSENSYGSVKSMESLNMFKQFIGKFYLQKLH
jgi:hypothetical protein